ncbi:MAG: hypothetical protein ABJG78_13615 [Cyclobacteriaceae bacterium]
MKRSSLLLILSFGCFPSICQIAFDKNYEFLEHLSAIGAYKEGVHFINKNASSYQVPGQSDTLNYLKGVFLYRLKSSKESIGSLSEVGNTNKTFMAHATFLSAFQYAYLGDHQSAESSLATTNFERDLNRELRLHLLAGISLLKRDITQFDSYSTQFSRQYFQIAPFQDQFIQNKEGLLKAKRKSPLVAGVLSGVVPGAGKFYVGKVGEGYVTLLLSAILGLQVREAYKKDGPSSFRFKLFTGLFSTLYVANIWGSVLSVKIYKDDFNETFDQAILLNMHVPIRTIFD